MLKIKFVDGSVLYIEDYDDINYIWQGVRCKHHWVEIFHPHLTINLEQVMYIEEDGNAGISY